MAIDNSNRLVFGSMEIPQNASKRVAHYLEISLPNAQGIVSQMLGFKCWDDLAEMTFSEHISLAPDEYATRKEQADRVAYQTKVLRRFIPLSEPLQRRSALILRVSALDPKSELLAFDGYRQNHLFHWKGINEPPEWRFLPSERSYSNWERLIELYDTFKQGKLSFEMYQFQIDLILHEQPENIHAYLHILYAFVYSDIIV